MNCLSLVRLSSSNKSQPYLTSLGSIARQPQRPNRYETSAWPPNTSRTSGLWEKLLTPATIATTLTIKILLITPLMFPKSLRALPLFIAFRLAFPAMMRSLITSDGRGFKSSEVSVLPKFSLSLALSVLLLPGLSSPGLVFSPRLADVLLGFLPSPPWSHSC